MLRGLRDEAIQQSNCAKVRALMDATRVQPLRLWCRVVPSGFLVRWGAGVVQDLGSMQGSSGSFTGYVGLPPPISGVAATPASAFLGRKPTWRSRPRSTQT